MTWISWKKKNWKSWRFYVHATERHRQVNEPIMLNCQLFRSSLDTLRAISMNKPLTRDKFLAPYLSNAHSGKLLRTTWNWKRIKIKNNFGKIQKGFTTKTIIWFQYEFSNRSVFWFLNIMKVDLLNANQIQNKMQLHRLIMVNTLS